MNAKLKLVNLYLTKQNHSSLKKGYSASEKTLKEVWNALNGKFLSTTGKVTSKSIFGPNFFANKTLEKDILTIINNPKKDVTQVAQKISKADKGMQNSWSLILGKQPPQKVNSLTSAKRFLKELKTEIKLIDKTCDKLNFSKKEKKILHDFIARTASPLHLMGFKDAIPHAAEVSRLCMIEAKKQGAKTTVELLQAAMTGWIHDPKLASYISKENLATHPIVASSIAKNILSKPKMQKNLLELCQGDKTKVKEFTTGIEKALGINNDSLFVTQNVILNGKIKESIKSAQKFNSISEKAIDRYWHNTHSGLKLKRFNRDEVKTLKCIKFETGLKGINKNDFTKAYNNFVNSHSYKDLKLPNGQPKTAKQVLNEITSGEITNLKLINGLHKELQKINAKVKGVDVNALSLFTHNAELTQGQLAANALATADPKLLSLHKVITQNIYPDVTSRVASFVDSFDNNIKGLQLKALGSGKTWEADYLKSILESIDKINHPKALAGLNSKLQNLSPQEKINTLKEMLKNPQIWQSYNNANANSQNFKRLVHTIEKDYHKVTEHSAGLYSLA